MRLSLKRSAWTAVMGIVAAGLSPCGTGVHAQPAAPASVDPARLARIDALVERAVSDKLVPGAVVLVGRGSRVVYQKTFGQRAIEPQPEPMTPDTIFDAASLTKVVATTTSVMLLVEEGRLRLNERVASYIPGFERYGKGAITIRHLLVHMSGLRPDLDLADPWTGYDTAIARAIEEVPVAPPDTRFIYSDINFFLLGDIVARVSGMGLDRFARERVFRPLGMTDTTFNPPPGLRPRIAPTERCTPLGSPCDGPDADILRGVVHDPTARRMGGVAGHAGLFTTAADLARFARMLLGGGALDGVRVLSPLAVSRMISPSTPASEPNVRGLGWDLDSTYSSNRGELLPPGSFGHTGYTGTSIRIDPHTGLFVILLSNRVHPQDKGDLSPLRAAVATVAASSLTDPGVSVKGEPFGGLTLAPAGQPAGVRAAAPQGRSQVVLTGIDVLRAEGFARLRGRRIGLLTNHTGLARDGQTTIDLLHQARDVTLVSLLSPEHGIRGALDEKVSSGTDEKTGLLIHSLYFDTLRPTPEMLAGIDTLVIDLQDVGARFYTYATTLAYAMEEAAKQRVAVVVLDRPNPINGWEIEGPTIETAYLGHTAYYPMPVRHGMTLGELARLFKAENRIEVDLSVVEMQGWQRGDWFDATGLRWVNPSPNMRNLNEATLYPGIGAIEGTNISVGRGTDTPFEHLGAPWIDGVELAAALNGRRLAGITFYPVSFTPTSSKYQDERSEGVFMVVTDRTALRPVRVGLEIASALVRLYGAKFDLNAAARLFGSRATLEAVARGDDPARIAASWSADESKWRLLRGKYLLYR